MRTILGVFALCTIGLTGSAFAQTPDAETPANEGVCNVVEGGSPGLYGLCVAYCEAQDLDAEGKAPPSEKILANYRKRMGPGDPDMPCIQKPCDCWSSAELESMTSDGLAACFTQTDKDGNPTYASLTDNGVKNYASVNLLDAMNPFCIYTDAGVNPVVSRQFWIKPENAKSCLSQILTAWPTCKQ